MFADGVSMRSQRQGRGRYLGRLDDALLLGVLRYFPGPSLCGVSATCRQLLCFAWHEELWRDLVLNGANGNFSFRANWRRTFATSYVASSAGAKESKDEAAHPARGASAPSAPSAPSTGAACAAFACAEAVTLASRTYSDALFLPWYFASLPIDPSWVVRDNVDRPSARSLSVADFVRDYDGPGRPCVLRDVVTEWEAFKSWTPESLCERFGDRRFNVGGYPMRLKDYFAYAEAVHDDQLLYLFDKNFAKTAPALADEYQVPAYFQEDLFSALGARRPHYRWLIAGPKRSGSSWHVDPNRTSAWNACIRGRKKWIMFPPHVQPPGVEASADGTTVQAPVSLIEWFHNFYRFCARTGANAAAVAASGAAAETVPSAALAAGAGAAAAGTTRTAQRVWPVEFVQEAGDMVFVPRGWWHVVLNLEDTIAITQNFVSSSNLVDVIDYTRQGGEVVSGVPEADVADLSQRFSDAVEQAHPGLIARRREATRSLRDAEDGTNGSKRSSPSVAAVVGTTGAKRARKKQGPAPTTAGNGSSSSSSSPAPVGESSGGFSFNFF
eukprot:g4631.t1